jgi:hypothetical protein
MADTGTRLSRRSLLNIGWRSLVIAGVAPADQLAAFAKPLGRGLENATAESFAPHVGETFEFAEPAGERGLFAATIPLKLKAVTRHDNVARIEARMPSLRGARKRESFSLLFELQGGRELGPSLHEFAHGEFKGSPLFLSRVLAAKKARTILYEAVFG